MESVFKRMWALMILIFCLCGIIPAGVKAAERADKLADLPARVTISGFLSEEPAAELYWNQVYTGTSGQYYFFLPALDSKEVKIRFWNEKDYDKETGEIRYTEETGYVTINGKDVYSGDSVALPAGGSLTMTTAQGNVRVGIKQSKNIASMFVRTKSGSMDAIHADKEYKEKGSMLLIRADGTVDYSFDQGLKSIKGRGNATWRLPKRPYNIKLEKSADLLGMGKAKGWCLLANFLDTSLMRNKIVYNLADETGVPFNMACESVDLYTNGAYQGTYLLTEKVEIDKNRVNVTDLEGATVEANLAEDGTEPDLESFASGGVLECEAGSRRWMEIPKNPADITGGYLIELELSERYSGEACGFVSKQGQPVTMKAPEFVSKAQIDYIADFYQEFEDALYSKTGYNKDGKHFTDYMDEESIAKMYLIQEYSGNLDSGITSFYLYKDSDKVGDGKLHMTTAWDFDIAIGNHVGRYYHDLMDPSVWWADQSTVGADGPLTILAQAVQYESVRKQIAEQWNEVFRPAVKALLGEETDYKPQYIRPLDSYREEIRASAEMNTLVWPLEAIWGDPNSGHETRLERSRTDFEGSVVYVRNYLTRREELINSRYGYGQGEGYIRLTGTVTVEGTPKVGNTLTAKVEGSNAKNLTWQWMADGKAIVGANGESYVIREEDQGKLLSVSVRADEAENILSSLAGSASGKAVGNEEPKPDPEPDPEPDPKPMPDPNEKPDDVRPAVLPSANVTKVTSTQAGVKVQFSASANAGFYEIYRKIGGKYTKICSTKSLVWMDTAPIGGKNISYAIKAISGDRTNYLDAGYGAEKSIQLPVAPQRVKAKALKGKKVSLSWKRVKGASAVLLYRADSKNGKYKLVGKVKKQTSSYTDKKKLKPGKKYYYKAVVLKGGKYSPAGKTVRVSVKK